MRTNLNKKDKVVNQTSVDAMANVVGNLAFFFSLWIITTIISKVSQKGYYDVGVFSLAMTFCNIFTTFSTFASRGYMVSDIKGEYTTHEYVSMRLGTVLVSCISCIAIAMFLGYRGETMAAIICYMLYRCCDAYSDVFHGIMQMNGKLIYAAYGMIAKSVLCTILFMVSLWKFQNLIFSMSIMVIVGVLINIFYDQRKVRAEYKTLLSEKLRTSIHTWPLLIKCFPLMINGVVMTMLVAIPRLVLEKSYSTDMLGVYTSVTAPTVIISTFATSLATPLLPYCSRMWLKKDRKGIYTILFGPMIFVLICCLIGIPIAKVFGGSILAVLYTKEISGYVNLFIIACVTACILACVTLANNMLLAARLTKNIVAFSGIACIITSMLAIPFVRKWGMYGAAYTLTFAYSIELLVQIIFLIILIRKHVKIEKEG